MKRQHIWTVGPAHDRITCYTGDALRARVRLYPERDESLRHCGYEAVVGPEHTWLFERALADHRNGGTRTYRTIVRTAPGIDLRAALERAQGGEPVFRKIDIRDLDGTISYGTNERRHLWSWFYRHGPMSGNLGGIVSFVRHAFDYNHLVDTRQTLATNKAYLCGTHAARLGRETFQRVLEQVDAMVSDRVELDLVDASRRGHLQVLMTGSWAQIAVAYMARFGFDAVIAWEGEVIDGRFTARSQQLPKGENKRIHAETLARALGASIREAWGNAYSDWHYMERSERPIATNPDRELEALAIARGWERRYYYGVRTRRLNP